MQQRTKKNCSPAASGKLLVIPGVGACAICHRHLLLHICFIALCFQPEVLHAAKGHGVFFSMFAGTSCVALEKSLNLFGLVFYSAN